jgi:hypothetical protein
LSWRQPSYARSALSCVQLPDAFSVNFIDGAESTARILHTLDLAVAVGRIMAADHHATDKEKGR